MSVGSGVIERDRRGVKGDVRETSVKNLDCLSIGSLERLFSPYFSFLKYKIEADNFSSKLELMGMIWI